MKLNFVKTIRNLGILALIVLLIPACQSGKTRQISNLQNANDSLKSVIVERDSLMNDMVETFNQIETDLAFIKEQHNLISVSSQNSDVNEDKKQEIVKDVQDLAKLLKESKSRLAHLNRKLKAAGVQIASLEKRISSLSDSLDSRNNEVLALTQDLEKKNYEVGQLTDQLVELKSTNEQQDNLIKEQTATIDTFNTGYYVLGTAKELKEKGLITKEGGFLGIGKTKTLSSDANNSYFSEFDIRKMTSIPINAKQAHLITEHPAGSYEFVKKDDKVASMTIKDPSKFYKFSKYIVVEIQ